MGLPLLAAAEVEIVIEAVFDGRPDSDLGLGIEFQHGLGHDMRGAVPDLVKLVFFSSCSLPCDIVVSSFLAEWVQNPKSVRNQEMHCGVHQGTRVFRH